MKMHAKTLALIGALALVPAMALAQTKPAPSAPKAAPKAAAAAPAKPAATHSTTGIIKSADATSLVIAKTEKDTKTTTFALNSATVSKGAMTPGARVEVRYRTEGTQNIATAVTATPAKSMPKSGK
ncbi:MAG: hypothetical protein EPO35_01715 [Acidobacteria bacterium]|nr:MAG: hypothetical protein EPO35_01715 [Acidobacteriota bacterium]